MLTDVYNKVSTIWYNDLDDPSVLAQNKEILKIGNVLNSLFVDKNQIDIPRIVVVGSQSSGKSTLLNSILGMDILPTGSNMVTRSPLQIELIQTTEDTNQAVFGDYKNGIWEETKCLELSYPDIKPEQKLGVSKMIETITTQNAGSDMNITLKPIYLRIRSKNLPNLSLVDLPGLTMVACTDKGQPKDIKDQIRNMVGEYIKPKNTIILAVMPARSDIEADIALDLIKDYDSTGERTIGVLTKLDLMNEGTDITNLLENNVSIDLKLKYGYFGIRNRTKKESLDHNVMEGLAIEREYFTNHSIYSNMKYKDSLGIPSLCKNLSCILIDSIKRCLPKILHKINENILDNTIKLDKLGTELPNDDHARSAYVHHLLSTFCRKFISVLDDRGNNINSGRNIKDCFIEYRNEIASINPFNESLCNNEYILEAIRNCEGNHMTFPSPPIEVLEQIIKDTSQRPIFKLYEPSKKCSESVMAELITLVNILLDDVGILRFPLFTKLVKNQVLNNILVKNFNNTLAKIKEQIQIQENYLWTDNIDFISILDKKNDKDTLQISLMRNLLVRYYQTVSSVLQDTIPKTIMFFLVKETEDNLSTRLYEIIKDEPLDGLLQEYDEIHQTRLDLERSSLELNSAKELIETIV